MPLKNVTVGSPVGSGGEWWTSGGIQQSINNGSFELRRSPPGNLGSIFGFSSDEIYFGDVGGNLFKFDGAWHELGAIDGYYSGISILCIWGTSGTNLWLGCTSSSSSPVLYHFDGYNFSGVNLPTGTDLCVKAIWGTSNDDVWAAGYDNSSYPTRGIVWHFDGATWTESFRSSGSSTYMLKDIKGTSSNNIYVVAESGLPAIILYWDGFSWTETTLPGSPTGFRSIWIADANNVYIGGKRSGYQSIWKWNGLSWSIIQEYASTWPGGGFKLFGFNNNDIWAIGNEDSDDPDNRFTYHWNGSSWSFAAVPQTSTLGDGLVWGASTDNIYIGQGRWNGSYWSFITDTPWGEFFTPGGSGGVWGTATDDVWINFSNSVFRNSVDGIFKDVRNDDSFPYRTVIKFWGTSNSNVYAMCSAHIYHWNGSTWSLVPSFWSGEFSATYYWIWGLDANHIWVVYKHKATAFSNEYFAIQYWNGTTWTRIYDKYDGNRIYSIWGPDATTLYIVGQYAGSGCARALVSTSGNAGPWNVISELEGTYPSNYIQVNGSGANDIWVVNDGLGKLSYHWNGASWNALPTDMNPLRGIEVLSSTDAVAMGTGGVTWDWDGFNWTETIHHENLSAIKAVGNGYVAFGENLRIKRNGSWEDFYFARDFGNVNYTFSSLSNNNIYVGTEISGRIHHWDGSDWEIVEFPGRGHTINGARGFGIPHSICVSGSSIFIGDDCSRIHMYQDGYWSTNILAPTVLKDIRRIVGFSPNEVYAVCNAHTDVYFWNGTTWVQCTGFINYPRSLKAADNFIYLTTYVGGTVKLYRAARGATSFLFVCNLPNYSQDICVFKNRIWTSYSGYLYHSTDLGETWTTTTPGSNVYWSTTDLPLYRASYAPSYTTDGINWIGKATTISGSTPIYIDGYYEYIGPELPDIECCFGVSQYGSAMYGNCEEFTETGSAPFIVNEIPTNLQVGVDLSTTISADVLDELDILSGSVRAYVNDELVFDGYSFIYPYTGSVIPVIIDGYSGCHIIVEKMIPYQASDWIVVRLTATNTIGLSVDENWRFYTKTSIEQVEQGPYEITFDITFTGPMYDDIELTNSSNYKFTNGAYARKVEKLDSSSVRVWSELVFGQSLFDLTISSNVKDSYGIPLAGNTIPVVPFYSLANISNYNGKIRTNHSSKFVTSDSQRIYLAGAKGIDVFKIERKTINRTWAQIFDAYGIDSMFVVNYPNDVSITDTQPPYIGYALPGDGETAFPDTHVLFIVNDAATSIELSSITIYLNGVAAFRGNYGGWQDGFCGNLALGYKSVGADIWMSTPFAVGSYITVRIIASDLMGNIMDRSYVFEIISESEGGWGFGPFGLFPFGGV